MRKKTVNRTFRLKADTVQRLDPVATLKRLAQAADRRRGRPASRFRPFTKDELHEDC